MRTLFLVVSLFCSSTFASLLPENNFNIPVGEKSRGVGKAFYDFVIDRLDEMYRPVMDELGVDFEVERLWEDGQVNAAVMKTPSVYKLRVYGGLARFSPMEKDPFVLVLCHEIGHLFGGAPTWKPHNFVSSEGQADYYSTLKCFRKFVADDDNDGIIGDRPIHPLALDRCGQSFGDNSKDYSICLRSSLAIEDLANVLVSLREGEPLPKLDTPDPYVRRVILFNGYPNIQCRIDTLFAGSICAVTSETDVFSNDKYNENVCSVFNGDLLGKRPKCWYAPREDNN